MKTSIAIDGQSFLVNGRPTYEGRSWRGRSIQGLLFNSRMVQAVFDDQCEQTRSRWVYPDTGTWDPDRNTDEFCAMLPIYRENGLLAVTVGLQGGGSVYASEVYEEYQNSAFSPDGSLLDPYFDRLARIIRAADAVGMVVIVNYFYWKQTHRFINEQVPFLAAQKATEYLLRSGYDNILVDVANESNEYWKYPALEPESIHRLIDAVKQTTINGRGFLTGCSTAGHGQIPTPQWLAAEDITLPHGNSCTPADLTAKLRRIRQMEDFRRRPRPLLTNEDSINLDNLDAAINEYASWGFYAQGAGSKHELYDAIWKPDRETRYEDLSGFQTVPVNWSINTHEKRQFFNRLREITSGETP